MVGGRGLEPLEPKGA